MIPPAVVLLHVVVDAARGNPHSLNEVLPCPCQPPFGDGLLHVISVVP